MVAEMKKYDASVLTITVVIILGMVSSACILSPDSSSSPPEPNFLEGSSLGQPPEVEQPVTSMSLMTDVSNLFCPLLQFPLINDLNVYQTPLITAPTPRVSFHDPIFGACLARVTDHNNDLSPDASPKGIRTEASNVQSFNADSSLMLVRGLDDTWLVYSVESMQLFAALPFEGELEVRWDPLVPDRLYYFKGSRLYRYMLSSGEVQTLHDFNADFPNLQIKRVGTNNTGSPSLEGHYWGLVVQGLNGQALALVLYDLSNDQVIVHRDLPDQTMIQGVLLSPTGNYLLSWYQQECTPGKQGSDATPCGMMVYDRDLNRQFTLVNAIGSADTGLDQQGSEIMVFYDLDLNSISMVNLETGERTDLWLVDSVRSSFNLQVSGRALNLPGWALISTINDNGGVDQTWMDNSIFAIELKPEGRVVRLAHTHHSANTSEQDNLVIYPSASPNLDLTRILFTSNWGQPNTVETDVYMLGLPAKWVHQIP